MAHVPRPSGRPSTPLWLVGWNIDGISRRFKNLAEDISGVWLLGSWLASPFYAVGVTLSWAADKLFDADNYLSEISVWVNGLVGGSTFTDLLYYVSGHFAMIRFNAKGWVLGQLNSLHWEIAYFAVNPLDYFKWKIGTLIWNFPVLIANPWGWFKSLAWVFFPTLYPFLVNPYSAARNFLYNNFYPLWQVLFYPSTWLRNLIWANFPDLYQLLTNPALWLTFKIAGLFPVAYPILSDPEKWLKEQIRQMLGLPYGFWFDPAGSLTKMIMDYIEARLLHMANRLSRLAIALIIHFM